jgi:hypothetical protein
MNYRYVLVRLYACIAGILSGVLLVSCGSSESVSSTQGVKPQSPLAKLGRDRMKLIPDVGGPGVPDPAELTSARWRILKITESSKIEIASSKGYCVGAEPPPRYEAVRIVERGKRVEITTFVRKANSSPPGGVCSGVGYGQYGTVKLSRPVSGLRLYDGEIDPRRLRWPNGEVGKLGD